MGLFMREFLDEAQKHIEDGIARVKKEQRRVLAKRFYKNVSVKNVKAGFAIFLDDKMLKTQKKRDLVLKNEKIAKLLAAEWEEQKKEINLFSMPINRLVNLAIDGEKGLRDRLKNEIIKYAACDLLLYRAQSPKELLQQQEEKWDIILTKLAKKFNIKFIPTIGILHQEQPAKTLKRLREAINNLDRLNLIALMSITNLSGSALLAIAIYCKLIDEREALIAANIDEDYNIKIWGMDEEARINRKNKERDFFASAKLLNLLN